MTVSSKVLRGRVSPRDPIGAPLPYTLHRICDWQDQALLVALTSAAKARLFREQLMTRGAIDAHRLAADFLGNGLDEQGRHPESHGPLNARPGEDHVSSDRAQRSRSTTHGLSTCDANPPWPAIPAVLNSTPPHSYTIALCRLFAARPPLLHLVSRPPRRSRGRRPRARARGATAWPSQQQRSCRTLLAARVRFCRARGKSSAPGAKKGPVPPGGSTRPASRRTPA